MTSADWWFGIALVVLSLFTCALFVRDAITDAAYLEAIPAVDVLERAWFQGWERRHIQALECQGEQTDVLPPLTGDEKWEKLAVEWAQTIGG